MLKWFSRAWDEVPIVVIDVETTGIIPGVDQAVQVALVRFEKREVVGRYAAFVHPGRKIPEEATKIHGITDRMVSGAAPIDETFDFIPVRELLQDAQPAAYNAHFDRQFVPLRAFQDWTWPWLDPLTAVRAVDRYVRGQGRHKLEAACARRDIPIVGAHDALVDAEATGHLLYRVFSEVRGLRDAQLGHVLAWQRRAEADQWESFNEYLSRQPQGSA